MSFGGPGGAAGNGGAVIARTAQPFSQQRTVPWHRRAERERRRRRNWRLFSATGVIAKGTATKDLSVSVGGVGGIGGTAGHGHVDNFGNITARGGSSRGIFAQSVGGSGGDGGFSFAGTFAGQQAKEGAVTVGGFGGDGGAGGTVMVTNDGVIDVDAFSKLALAALAARPRRRPTRKRNRCW